MSDVADEDIDNIVDSFFDAREAIFAHVGYVVEDWRDLPIDDSRDYFWAVDADEHEWVKFSPSREALVYWLAGHDDEYGPHGDMLDRNEICAPCHLSKKVLRGGALSVVVVDTYDGHQYLQLFRNSNEVRPGDTTALPPPAEPLEPTASGPRLSWHPLNQAIDRMIEASQKAHEDGLIAKVRSMCAEVPVADLKTAIIVHRTNCHEADCPVLAAMEEVAMETAP